MKKERNQHIKQMKKKIKLKEKERESIKMNEVR